MSSEEGIIMMACRGVSSRLLAMIALVLASLAGILLATGAPAGAYPVGTCARVTVSSTSPTVGSTITITGAGFTPGNHLTVVVQASPGFTIGGPASVSLPVPPATIPVTASATGTFTLNVTVRGTTGAHVISVTGETGTGGCSSTPSVGVNFQSGVANAGETTGGSGALAETGSNLTPAVGAAVVLLGGGGAALLLGRRRREGSTDA